MEIKTKTILDDNFKILAQTEDMIVGYLFETAYIVEKRTSNEIVLGDFYGEATFALISSKENWCLVGGESLILWIQGDIFPIEISDIYEMRQIDKNIVEILTDPWSEKSGIWQLDVIKRKIDFIREFRDYKDKKYSEKVDW